MKINKEKINHGLVLKMEEIGDFEKKLELAKKDNWKIKNIIRDCGKFEDLGERMQEMMINWIKDNIYEINYEKNIHLGKNK